jgi:hypothetical protein
VVVSHRSKQAQCEELQWVLADFYAWHGYQLPCSRRWSVSPVDGHAFLNGVGRLRPIRFLAINADIERRDASKPSSKRRLIEAEVQRGVRKVLLVAERVQCSCGYVSSVMTELGVADRQPPGRPYGAKNRAQVL